MVIAQKISTPNRLLIPALLLLAFSWLGCGSNPDDHFWTAVEHYKRKDYSVAQTYLRKALALDPEYIPAYLLLGRIGVEKGDNKTAELNYSAAYNLAHDRDFKLQEEDLKAINDEVGLYWQEAAYYLADQEFKSKNYNRAIAYYDQILETGHDPSWKKKAYEAKNVTRDFFDYRNRLEMLRSQNYSNPDDPRVKAEMSLLFMEMATALTRIGKLKSVSEQVGLSRDFRKQAKENLEDLYSASPEVNLPQTEAVLAYAESQDALMRRKFEQALEKAKEAARLDSQNARYHFAVANILQILENQEGQERSYLDEILSYAKRAVDLEPDVWRYLVFYAGRLREMGQLEESYAYLKKALRKTDEKAVTQEIEQTLSAIENALAAEKAQRGGS